MSAALLPVGLVGYGFGGRYFHAPFLASGPGCRLAGVVTRSPERRALVEADFPGTPVFDDLAELVAEGVQAVAISTPAHTRTALILEAIERGLSVSSDKPFALDAAVARRCVDAAAKAGVLLTVYQNRRWDSDLLTLRRLLDAAALGTVSTFESRFERFSPDTGAPEAGAGALRDFGSHLVDQALLLFGPAVYVYAEMDVVEPDRLDDQFFVALRHRGGITSHLSGSWHQGAPGPRFRVAGSEGAFVVEGVDSQEEALVAGASPATLGDRWGLEPEDRWGRIQRGEVAETVPSERGRWDTFYPAFAAAVQGQGPPPVDPLDAVATVTVLDAARASAASGHVVEL